MIGAVTGVSALVVSGWNAVRADMTRIKVDPNVPSGSPSERLAPTLQVRITNQSPFPVTIERGSVVARIDGDLVDMPLEARTRTEGFPIELGWQQSCALDLTYRAALGTAAGTLHHAYVVTTSGVTAKSSRMHRLRGKGLHQIMKEAEI